MRLPGALLLAAAIAVSATSPHQTHPQAHPNQQPLMSNPSSTSAKSSALLLSDTLSSQRSLSIFASLARDDMNTSAALGDRARYTVVLAPTNAALQRMAHKPWEDPVEMAAVAGTADGIDAQEASSRTYAGADGADRAERNLRRFVRGCLVGFEGEEEWKEGEKRRRGGSGDGKDGEVVWWETKEGQVTVMPQGIKVEGVVSRVVNGEVWAIDGTFAV